MNIGRLWFEFIIGIAVRKRSLITTNRTFVITSFSNTSCDRSYIWPIRFWFHSGKITGTCGLHSRNTISFPWCWFDNTISFIRFSSDAIGVIGRCPGCCWRPLDTSTYRGSTYRWDCWSTGYSWIIVDEWVTSTVTRNSRMSSIYWWITSSSRGGSSISWWSIVMFGSVFLW